MHFSNSGSEANEVAFKIARQYHAQTGDKASGWRYKIISRYRAYHGNTMGALSATGQTERRSKFEPLVPGFLHVPPPYCYRCPFGKTYESCNIECATSIENTVLHEGPQSVAAIIVEPVILGGGVIVPFDEVVSGFSRLGKMLGHEHWGVKPDIITLERGSPAAICPSMPPLCSSIFLKRFWMNRVQTPTSAISAPTAVIQHQPPSRCETLTFSKPNTCRNELPAWATT